MKQVYAIYYNQCDDDMKSTLAENPSFEKVNKDKDLIELYKILLTVNFSYTHSEEPIMSMWKAKSDFVKIRQAKGQTVNEYFERFIALRDVNDTLKATVYDDMGLADVIAIEQEKDFSTMTQVEIDQFKTNAIIEGTDRMTAIHFLLGADQERYGGLIRSLRHSYI
jgi:hypothetical protein